MKRILLVVAALAIVGVIVAVKIWSVQQPQLMGYSKGGQDTDGVFIVVPSDVRGDFRRGGSKVFLCSGSGDEAVIQRAIDASEACTGQHPEVHLIGGTYDIDNPIYVGYSGGQPNQNAGCTLRAVGKVIFESDISDYQLYTIYFSPSSERGQPSIIGPIDFQGVTQCGQIYSSGLHHGRIQNVGGYGGGGAAIWLDQSWDAVLDQISFNAAEGIALGVHQFNGGVIRKVVPTQCSGHKMGATGWVGVKKYSVDSHTGFYPGEKVRLTNAAGAVRGVFLSGVGGFVWIAHVQKAVFENTNVIYGNDSQNTATVNSATVDDIGSCIYLHGEWGKLTGLVLDNCEYTSDIDQDYDYPLVLVQSHSDGWADAFELEGLRFESGTAADRRRQAHTYIKIDHADGTVVRDVYAMISANGGDTIALNDNSVDVNGDGDGTSTIANVSTAFIAGLVAGDKVHLWDGGANDGEYTVEAGFSGTSFGISDGDFTDGDNDMYCYNKTASEERETPQVLVDIVDCEGVVVENVRHTAFGTAVVRIDADSSNTSVANIVDHWRNAGVTEGTWLYNGKTGAIVADSGTGTKLLNPYVGDYTTLEYAGKSGVEVVDETDGTFHKTTLLIESQSVTMTDAGAGDDGYGSVKIFDFPAGRILVLGVIANLRIDVSDKYDSGTSISDTGSGDFSLGSTATSDTTLDGTDVDMCASSAMDDPFVSGIGANLHGELAASAHFDGTSVAKDCYLNAILDAGDITANSTAGFDGIVTIHWVELGDY